MLLLAGVLLLVGVVAWAVWLSPLLDVRKVVVRGIPDDSPLTAADVRSAAGVENGRPLAGVDLDLVRERLLRRLPALESVVVERDWPHALVLEVTERRPVALLRDERTYHLVDATGVAFREVPRPPRGLLPVELEPGTQSPDKTLRAAVTVVTRLPSELRGRVRLVSARSPHAVRLTLRGGAEVMWGAPDQARRKARVLEILLKQRYDEPVELYDVSVPAYPTVRV